MSFFFIHVVEHYWHISQTARVKTFVNNTGCSYCHIFNIIGISKFTVWDLVYSSSARRFLFKND